jgi:hypothetical protein
MSFDRNKNYYKYIFSNREQHTMTPIEAHQYARRKMIDILQGPGYEKGKREKEFDGFGWHSGLLMSFKGPAHYRQYLKENNMHEASINDRPMLEENYEPPVWNEELLRKAINEHGLQIGSVLAEALLNGELDWPEEG